MIAANLGVNPSLTICALTERAMSYIPPAASTPDTQAAVSPAYFFEGCSCAVFLAAIFLPKLNAGPQEKRTV